MRATGRENAWKLLQELDRLLGGQQWVLGSRYSVAPYSLVIYGWGKLNRMPVEELKSYTAFKGLAAPGRSESARTREEPAASGLTGPDLTHSPFAAAGASRSYGSDVAKLRLGIARQ